MPESVPGAGLSSWMRPMPPPPRRAVIADDPGAAAHIKRNPTRREDRLIDRTLRTERPLFKRFCNKRKRLRSIAPHCKKTVSPFNACADLASHVQRPGSATAGVG